MAARTTFGGGAPAAAGDSIAAYKERMAQPHWASPRIPMSQAAQFAGKDVTFAGRALAMDGHSMSLQCLASGVNVEIIGVPPGLEVSTMNEVTCYVPENGQGPFHFCSVGMLNDDFDADVYKQLVTIIGKQRDLFY